MANGLLSPVERQTRDVFGMVPMEERLSLLPRYSKSQGLIAPQFIYELAKAVAAPITAAKGYSVSPEEAINVSMAGMGGGAFGSAPKGSLRTFIGRNAKTWDKAAETKFLELEKKGINPVELWQQTGTFRGVDKKLRQEVSDDLSQLTQVGKESFTPGVIDATKPKFKGNLQSVFEHQKIYDAYPTARNIDVTASPMLEGGAYRERESPFLPKGQKAEFMEISQSGANPKSSILHELQHSIQMQEGFTRGGSPEGIRRNFMELAPTEWIEYAKSLPNYQNKKTPEEKKAFIESFVQMRLGSPDEAYWKLAGEAEARAVQARMNMTPAQRSQTFPLQSYDVPVNQLIIKGLIE
jgi:hypothetical protein